MATASVVPSGGTLLLEREAQVAALEALAGAARGGDGRFVVIEGSVGIGKTRLLAEARAIARPAAGGASPPRPRRRAGGGPRQRDGPTAFGAAARLSQSGSPCEAVFGACRAR